jgi:hypothetical protein
MATIRRGSVFTNAERQPDRWLALRGDVVNGVSGRVEQEQGWPAGTGRAA